MNKKTLTNKTIKDFNKYLLEIKPKSSKNLNTNDINKTQDIILGLAIGQSCYLNTISQNTNHYKQAQKDYEKGKRDKPLTNTSQIDKYSTHLLKSQDRFNKSYHSFIDKEILSSTARKYEELKGLPLKDRINKQILMLHDTTDIQKPYAHSMENVGQTRDGSEGQMGNGYYAEGSILFHGNKIIPLKLKLISPKEEKYLSKNDKIDSKKACEENIQELYKYNLSKYCIHVLDRC